MNHLQQFGQLVREEMTKYGLYDLGWEYKYDEAKKRLGQCRYRDKTLSFSLPYVRVNEIGVMHNTILHEIAHALCTPRDHHGPAWKAMARKLGAKPQACNSDPRIIKPEGPYMFVCGCTTYYFHRSDALETTRWCRRCGARGPVVRTGAIQQWTVNPNNLPKPIKVLTLRDFT